MNTNIELFSEDSIENVITCLNYDFDKVIYLCLRAPRKRIRSAVTSFLAEKCRVKKVKFLEIPNDDIRDIRAFVSRLLEKERTNDNNVFCDITGGEDIILVALGMVCSEEKVPLHEYVIEENKLIEYANTGNSTMSIEVPENRKELKIEDLIKLNGCSINYEMQKLFKENSRITCGKAKKLVDLVKENSKLWNQFAYVIRFCFAGDSHLHVDVDLNTVKEVVNALNSPSLRSLSPVLGILKRLGGIGLIHSFNCDNKRCSFTYVSDGCREILMDGGSALEIYTYLEAKQKYNDCMIGVHIDWDGVIHENNSEDVINEIDVIAMDGYVPVFISCKSGKLDSSKGMAALNELSTMAQSFGGKYTRKVLAMSQEPTKAITERAKEMCVIVKTP